MRRTVLGLVLVIAVRPWIHSTVFLLSWPYDLAEAAVDLPTVFILSDETRTTPLKQTRAFEAGRTIRVSVAGARRQGAFAGTALGA